MADPRKVIGFFHREFLPVAQAAGLDTEGWIIARGAVEFGTAWKVCVSSGDPLLLPSLDGVSIGRSNGAAVATMEVMVAAWATLIASKAWREARERPGPQTGA